MGSQFVITTLVILAILAILALLGIHVHIG